MEFIEAFADVPDYLNYAYTNYPSQSAFISGTANAMYVTPKKRTTPFNFPPVKKARSLGTLTQQTQSPIMSEYIERKHGGAVSGSTYAGSFGHASPGYDQEKSAFLKSGCGIRDYLAGTVSTAGANLTAWVGHASYRPSLIVNVVCQAIIRKLFYKALARDITSVSSLILSNTNAVDIWLEYFDMDSNVTRRVDVGVLATDTLGVAANRLASVIWNRIAAHEQDMFKYIYLVSADGSQAGAALSLGGLRIDILSTSFLKIQNVASSADVAVDDRESALNVRHVPLQGCMYVGKGNWTMQKSTLQNNAHGGLNEAPMESDGNTGIMVPNFNTGSTSAGVQTADVTGGWFLPQPAKQLMHVTGSGGVKLSPGAIKSDTLRYSVSQSFNTFVGSLINVPESVTTDAATWSKQHTSRGMFKLFGLTRMIHSETTPVNIWYELWYDVYAKVHFSHNEVYTIPSPSETILGFSQSGIANQ